MTRVQAAAAAHLGSQAALISETVSSLTAQLRSSDPRSQYAAADSLGKLGRDALPAVPALLELFSKSFNTEPAYPFPNRAALRAAVAICKDAGYCEAKLQVEEAALHSVRSPEPNISRSAAEALNELSKRFALAQRTVDSLHKFLEVRDHLGIRDRACTLGALLNSEPSLGLQLIKAVTDDKSSSYGRVNTLERPEDSKLGADRDFVFRITRPVPPGYVQTGGVEELVIIGPDRLRTIQRQTHSGSVAVYFDKPVHGVRALYDQLVKREP